MDRLRDHGELMVRGFVDMDPSAAKTGGTEARLQAGAAMRLDSVLAMRVPWRGLSDFNDLPTTQYEWTVAAMNQLGPKHQAHVAYVTDGTKLRAILPMFSRSQMGMDHYEFMSPEIGMPIDIAHTDRPSLDQLLREVIRLGRPIYLPRLLDQSPVLAALKDIAAEKRAVVQIEKAVPVDYLSVPGFTLQDRAHSAARVSIIATSYGLSGGPNDVIFQFASPSLEQVMTLFHESLQLQAPSQPAKKKKKAKAPKDLNTFEFIRTHAFHCAQRGEIRFMCLRLGGRLLAVQMFQVRKRSAWLLTASMLDRFRGTTLGTLLTHEAIRNLRNDNVERLVVSSAGSVAELGECKQMPCVNVRIYPWSSRSLLAMVLSRAGSASGRLLRRTPKRPKQA